MNKYDNLKENLKNNGTGTMKCFGNSMKPILESGSLITFETREKYEVGDIVFCKCRGRHIDAHKIIKVDSAGRYLIANNHGFENGWTKIIFGKAVKAEYNNIIKVL